MCLICVEFQNQKLTFTEARRNLPEMVESIGEDHAQEVEKMIDEAEEEYHQYVKKMIERGQKDIQEGNTISHEEMKRRLGINNNE